MCDAACFRRGSVCTYPWVFFGIQFERTVLEHGKTSYLLDGRSPSRASLVADLGKSTLKLRQKSVKGFMMEDAKPYSNLHEAAQNGTLQDVKRFIDNGDSPNTVDKNKCTPLHLAAWENSDVEVLKYLVSKGGDMNATNECGKTPLHFAAAKNPNVEVLEYIIFNSADINVKAKNGSTPLHQAASSNPDLQILRYLIDKGADVFAKVDDDGGGTPYEWASNSEKKDFLREEMNKKKCSLRQE